MIAAMSYRAVVLALFLASASFCQASEHTFRLVTAPISPIQTPIFEAQIVRLVKGIFRHIGVEAEIVTMPAKRSRLEAHEGAFDGLFPGTRYAGDKAGTLILVDEPVTRDMIVAASIQRKIRIRNWEDLKTHSVAYPLGWRVLDRHRDKFGTAHRIPNVDRLVDLLYAGRVDVVLHVHSILSQYENGAKVPLVLSEPLETIDVYLFLHKKHRELVPRLENLLRAMKKDGRFEELCPACFKSLSQEKPIGQ